jgi:hypothetical protein
VTALGNSNTAAGAAPASSSTVVRSRRR